MIDPASHKMCPIVWMSQSYRANGDIRICCQTQHGPTGGILKDSSGNILNARSADLQDIRNAPLAKEIRKTMMKGEWHEECRRCKTEEDAGMMSRRIIENKIWIKDGGFRQFNEGDIFTWEHLIKNTKEDGTINTEAIENKFFDLRFGNLCNLKCRMCGPTDSSQWYNDQVELWGDTYSDSHGKVKLIKNSKGKYEPEENVYNWHESQNFWKQMELMIPEIKKMYIVGGEPLLIDQHYNFLQKCVDLGYAKSMIVEYNSNITNIPNRAWNIWKHFNRIGIGASIDGVGNLNHYIRYPANWEQIWKNLKKLSEADGNFKMWWATTISVYNVWELPDMIKFILENKLPRVNDDNHKPIMTPHPLHGPHFLNIRMLPKNVKDKVAEKFKKEKSNLIEIANTHITDKVRLESTIFHIHKILDTYKEFMYAEDLSNNIEKFWYHTRKLDNIRGHKFENFCPEMYEMLKPYETIINE
jgi:hypothetical protein